jgi:hypothetical protein
VPQTAADLNAGADAQAALYDEVGLYTSDDLDVPTVADGGAPVAVSFSPAGDAGPTDDQGAVDGIAWADINTFTLTEAATHFGLWTGAELRRLEPLPHPVGPGEIPFTFGLGPAARTEF